jgi:hypothetical protein
MWLERESQQEKNLLDCLTRRKTERIATVKINIYEYCFLLFPKNQLPFSHITFYFKKAQIFSFSSFLGEIVQLVLCWLGITFFGSKQKKPSGSGNLNELGRSTSY